jgi:hypothetical protein
MNGDRIQQQIRSVQKIADIIEFVLFIKKFAVHDLNQLDYIFNFKKKKILIISLQNLYQ